MRKLDGHYRAFRFSSLALIESKDSDEPSSFHHGYDDGYKEGVDKGFSQGLSEGKSQGETVGYEEGLKKGTSEGEAKGREEFQPVIESVTAIQKELQAAKEKQLGEYTDNICKLVEQVARRVIHAELTFDSNQMVKLIEDAIKRMDADDGPMTIYVSKDDANRLHEAGTNKIGDYPIKADESLSIGDCRLETEEQQVTVKSEERLNACMETVKEDISSE